MKVIVNRPEAAVLPTRHHLALFRLAALVLFRMRSDGRRIAECISHEDAGQPSLAALRSVHVLNRDQSAVETFVLAIAAMVVVACYLVAMVTSRWQLHPVIVLLVSLLSPVLAVVVLQLPMYVFGGVVMPLWRRVSGSRNDDHVVAQTWLATGCILLASLYFARGATFARPIALVVLAFAIANAAAWLLLLGFRPYMERLEQELGGQPSDA